MNKRIKELALQADKLTTEENKYYNLMHYSEKFAELIIRECAEICDGFQERNVGMQPAECAGAIRKRFGVEE